MTHEEKIKARIVVSGRVQGVLYRRTAQQKATELGITGWAHNTIDGRVEIECEGFGENIEKFIEWCTQGPPLAKVENIEVEYGECGDEFSDFQAREFGF